MNPLSRITLTDHVTVDLQRTLRIPDDGREYPLPPGFGSFPVYRAGELRGVWEGDLVVPMHQREAMWLSFGVHGDLPQAVQVGVGDVCALTGEAFSSVLSSSPQNYVVVPDQPWLDGINAGDGFIRQFVTTRLGDGDSVEEQLSGAPATGGLRLSAFAPKPGWRPPRPVFAAAAMPCCCEAAAPASLGLGAGGRMRQEIYADEYGLAVWRSSPSATVRVQLVDALDFARLTGLPVPPTPISVESYLSHGLPWFDLYDPRRSDIPGSDRLAGVRTVGGPPVSPTLVNTITNP